MSPRPRRRAALEPRGVHRAGHFFRALGERLAGNVPAQEVLASVREEVLATTKLPMAIDFLLGELRHEGVLGPAMSLLPHYFTPFQAFVIQESENERLRFDLRVGLEILRTEAEYRAGEPTRQGIFLYQFEALCRNRLGYDRGLEAVGARSGVRRNVARVDSQGAPANRHGRYRRLDLRPQRVLLAAAGAEPSESVRRGRAADRGCGRRAERAELVRLARMRRRHPLRRAGRPDRAGQSPQGPAVPVLVAAATIGLPGGAAAEAGRQGTGPAAAASSAAGAAGNAAENHRRGAARRAGFDASSTSGREGKPP